MPQFTESQVQAWKRYEEVRQGGLCNMWDPLVLRLAEITKQEHLLCIKNYDELRAQATAKEFL